MYSDEASKVIDQAMRILKARVCKAGVMLNSPQVVKDYLVIKYAEAEREVFGVIWLNVKNRILAHEEMFLGTLTHCSVHPREVLKAALKHNAASAIFYHNHPSGSAEPSEADKRLTGTLTNALSIIDVRSLDHIVIGGVDTFSFAEHSMI